MKLYGYWRSSCSYRVRIALHYKGVDFQTEPVHLRDGRQTEADHLSKNPMAQVPVLELPNGLRLCQSLAILDYLESAYPAPALLPKEPYARARALELAEIINAGVQPFQNLSLLKQITALGADATEWARDHINRGLASFAYRIKDTVGRFAVGESPSFADVCLVPQLYSARRFAVEIGQFDSLLRIEEACLALPAFQRAHPDKQPDADT